MGKYWLITLDSSVIIWCDWCLLLVKFSFMSSAMNNYFLIFRDCLLFLVVWRLFDDWWLCDKRLVIHSFIHSFIQLISIVPPQVHYYSEAIPTQHGYCVGVSRRSATGNCKWRLHKVPTWLEQDLNSWTFGRKATDLPKSHHAHHIWLFLLIVLWMFDDCIFIDYLWLFGDCLR